MLLFSNIITTSALRKNLILLFCSMHIVKTCPLLYVYTHKVIYLSTSEKLHFTVDDVLLSITVKKHHKKEILIKENI